MIDGLPIGDIGATALLALVVLMVLTGRLVPRRTLIDTQKERDAWRKAAEERSSQITDLLSATDTSTRLIQAFIEVANEQRSKDSAQ